METFIKKLGQSKLVLVAGTLIVFCFYLLLPGQDKAFSFPLVTTTIRVGQATLRVEIANTPESWWRGLSGRTGLAPATGMLFVFPESARRAFWMKGMLFPLDIIWLDEKGVVVAITAQVATSTYPRSISPHQEVKYVLEVPAGFAAQKNITVGDRLTPAERKYLETI